MTNPQYEAAYPYAPAQTPAYASWIQRVGASLIDSLVLVPFYALAFGLGVDFNDGTINALYYVFLLVGVAATGYNRWFLAGRTGQSWGKKALGLRLVGEQTGTPIGAGLAFARDLAHFLDGVICNIGYLFPLWDAKKQTIADKLVKTIVVK